MMGPSQLRQAICYQELLADPEFVNSNDRWTNFVRKCMLAFLSTVGALKDCDKPRNDAEMKQVYDRLISLAQGEQA